MKLKCDYNDGQVDDELFLIWCSLPSQIRLGGAVSHLHTINGYFNDLLATGILPCTQWCRREGALGLQSPSFDLRGLSPRNSVNFFGNKNIEVSLFCCKMLF